MGNEELQKILDAIGLLAESSLLFSRAVIKSGATPEEAKDLTFAFMCTMVRRNKDDE